MCALADKYSALVFIDECHATGFFGATGRGTEEHWNMSGRVDIVNSTLGKALGGAAGIYSRFFINWKVVFYCTIKRHDEYF
jgi:glycine C-acetyltransferase